MRVSPRLNLTLTLCVEAAADVTVIQEDFDSLVAAEEMDRAVGRLLGAIRRFCADAA